MMIRSIAGALILVPSLAVGEVPAVATDIAPVHSLAARVMEGLGEPTLVVRPGASPHGYAMRPSEAAALQEADLFVWVGAALTPWLEGPAETLVQGEALALLSVDGTDLLSLATSENHSGHGHDHDGPIDPHAWLDPDNGKLWLDAIAAALSAMDPGNADAYGANAAAGRKEIDAAAAEAGTLLAQYGQTPLFVYHDGYRYLSHHFGLPPAVALAQSDAASPSAKRLAEVTEEIEGAGARCIFAEPQFGNGPIRTVAEGTGARTAILDPLGGEIDAGPTLYPELIRSLARTIADCNT